MRCLPHRRREPTERGVAAVEFAIVATLFFTLLFGVIMFGILFGYRQQITQATAEGARAAVPVAYTASNLSPVQEAARVQVNRSISETKRQCPTPLTAGVSGTLAIDGITCSFQVYPCVTASAGTGAPNEHTDCLVVTITVDNDTKPLIARLPFLSTVAPKTMKGTYIVQLSGNEA